MHGIVLIALRAAAAVAPFAIAYRLGPVGLEYFSDLPQSVFIQIMALLTGALFFLRAVFDGEVDIPTPAFLFPATAFLAWSALTLCWAHNRYEGVTLLLYWLACASLVPIVASAVRDARSANRLLDALAFSGAAVSVLGIGQVLGLDPWIIPQRLVPAATFGHRNFAAEFVVATLPLSAAAWGGRKAGRARALFGAAFAVSLLYLACAGSRGGILALGVEAAIGAILLGQKKGAVVLAATAALLFAVPYIPLRSEWEYNRHSISENNIRTRIVLWRNALEMVQDRPLTGTGLGNFKVFYPKYIRRGFKDGMFDEYNQPRHVHNEFLEVLVETGPIGLILLLGCLAVLAAAHVKAYEAAAPSCRYALGGIGVGAAGLLATACVSFPFHMPLPPFVIALYAGVLAGLGGGRTLQLRGPRIQYLAGAWLVGLVLISSNGYHRLAGEYFSSHSRAAALAENWDAVIALNRKAYRHDPGRARIRYPMGRAFALSGRPDEGARIFAGILRAYPHHVNSRIGLGLALTELGKYDEAEAQFTRVLDILPDSAQVHNHLGFLFQRKGDLERSTEAFRTAVRLDPDNAAYLRRLASVQRRQDQRAE